MIGVKGLLVLGLAGNERLKFAKAGLDETGLSATALDRLLSLEAVAGDTEDDAFMARDAAAFDELLRTRDGDTARRLGKNSCCLSQQADAGHDLVVGNVFGETAGFLHRADGIVTVRRRADGERLDDGLRLGHRLDDFRSFLHRLANR